MFLFKANYKRVTAPYPSNNNKKEFIKNYKNFVFLYFFLLKIQNYKAQTTKKLREATKVETTQFQQKSNRVDDGFAFEHYN